MKRQMICSRCGKLTTPHATSPGASSAICPRCLATRQRERDRLASKARKARKPATQPKPARADDAAGSP